MTDSGFSLTNPIRAEVASAGRERTSPSLQTAGTLASKVLDAASGVFLMMPNFTTGTRGRVEGTASNFATLGSHHRVARIEFRDRKRQENTGVDARTGVDPQTAPGAIENDQHEEEIRFSFGLPFGAMSGDDHPRSPSDIASIRLNLEILRTALRSFSTSRLCLDPHAHTTLYSTTGGRQWRKSHPQWATAEPSARTGAKNGPGSLPQECRK